VRAVLAKAALYPDSLRPKFRICDTLGVALPDDDATLPREAPKLLQALRSEGLRPSDLEFHPHNDTGLIVANSLAATETDVQ
jgi:citrate (Re)-synthase